MANAVQKKYLFPSLIAVGVLLSVSACAGGSAAGGADDGKLKIGVTVSNSTNPFFVKESETAVSEGKALGAEVLSQEAGEDVTTQSNQIDQFITSGVDFIVIDPVDSDGIGPAVKRAITAGIPVVGIDSETKNASANVTTDNTQAGQVSCVSLAEQIGGKGDIAIIDGTPIKSVSDRVAGCKAALQAYPDIKVVAEQRGDNSRDKALPVATDILTANPSIVAIFAINDPTAAGVELAAQQKGMKIVITSVDGAKAATDDIIAGGMITATAAQDPKALAAKGVEMGAALAKGDTLPETLVKLPTTLIDASTAADYTPWG
jgi:ribose transport system substrate-binding protein